jgi:elongation factor P
MKAKDVRKGQIILHKENLFRVMDAHHHTPGNLRAMVHFKLRNILTGNQSEQRVSSTEDIETADVFQTPASYLYADQEGYHFMNSESYEQVTLSDDMLGDGRFYLYEGMTVNLSIYNEQPIGVDFPQTVVLTIADAEPSIKGSTASNSPKMAKTDTGLQISVPAFVKVGDKIIVNTESGEYLSRAD